ncbi:ATP-dependent DNA ligase [Haloquadratum walsbyi]|uniref:DNA ligase n=1 Tax=Haloquadratum walsbyi J07HQW2 TaxID=1238425 RepID=U1NDP7_9EURY|nr:ATP-dependent DNA ligase [Haloquadratum walsbyi]ERG94853.1 MAG: DNA ligase I, ATP-dependent, dnl1 [Haloquadratum walsbyi J07HQW2]
MQFEDFADHVITIEAEPADLETISLVSELFMTAGHEGEKTLRIVVRFIKGTVFPAWSSQTLDIGPALLHETIAQAAGANIDAADVENRLADHGEIGAVAASYDLNGQQGLSAFTTSTSDPLTVSRVDETLRAVASTSGDGSQSRRQNLLFKLFSKTSSSEARILARLTLGEMRIGVGTGTVRDAITSGFMQSTTSNNHANDIDTNPKDGEDAQSVSLESQLGAHSKNDANANVDASESTCSKNTDLEPSPDLDPATAVEHALQVSNDYGMVATVAQAQGQAGLADISLEVGRPIQAMLAQAADGVDAVDTWDAVAVETKFDGARVQIHTDGESVSLYSRNMEDVTDPLPEIVEFISERITVPVILDAEVVAVSDDGDPLAFQEVLRRFRRKYDIDTMRESVNLKVHVFDCLHIDGTDLLDVSLRERRDKLCELFDTTDALSPFQLTTDPDVITQARTQALSNGHEGVMLKNPDSTYSPGSRGQHWLKHKPDVETLDLVVTGAEWGEGRRANLFGTFVVSARTTTDESEFKSLGKVATGLTDEQLTSLTEQLRPHVRSEDGQSILIEPAIIIEVGYEAIQRSPTYDSGLALRFPRVIAVRHDKELSDADSLTRIKDLTTDG